MPPGAHHGDPVGDVVDDGEVVRDEQVGEPDLLLQILQKVEDLRLDRDVERGDRLVADDDVRLQRERPGDADALALAAGEAVRIAVQVLGAEADHLQQPDRGRAPRRVGADAVDRERLGEDVRRPSCAD